MPNNSQVISQGKISIINGGSRAGGNLFHSFAQFSVPTLGVAYFNNALDIQNIISRVTGSSISSIDGLIRANGSANLFLINPNGIIFGPNAQLRIGGSFVASTASSLKLADGSSFSAKTPETKPLLTVSVPLGLQYGTSPGSITDQSQVADSSGTLIGLQVQSGKTLALVGGNVSLDSGGLTASGGRVELGGLAGAGTVGLSSDGSLSYPAAVPRADVAINNSAVSVAAGGGSIAVNARNLDISGGSSLLAGIGKGLGAVGTKAGDVTLNATDTITLRQASTIQNRVNPNAIGDSGNINIQAGALSITDGSSLSNTTVGQGNAGSVFVQANGLVSLANSSIINYVESGGVGNAGGISITAGSLSLTNGAQLQSSIRKASKTLSGGRGNAGNVNINTRDAITIAGANSVRHASAISSNVGSGAVGNGGNITIKAGSFSLSDGAQLIADTFGQGNAGSVFVQANGDVSFTGSGTTKDNVTGIFSPVGAGAVGNGGGISIAARSLSLDDSAQLSTSTGGQGNAGNIQVNATDSVSIRGGSVLQADTFARGNAGSVTIAGRDGVLPVVSLDGMGADGALSSVFTAVGKNSTGRGGDINITARALYLTNGAQLNTSTSGKNLGQNAGNIRVNVSDSLTGSDGSGLQSNSYGLGNAGSVTVQAGDAVAFDGVRSEGVLSGIATFLEPVSGFVGDRKGGDINITARSLSLTNGAELNAISGGQGNAGNVNINVSNAVTFDGVGSDQVPGGVVTKLNGGMGKGGDINISTGLLSLTNGAQLLAYTSGIGDAGNIRINARNAVTFDGVSSSGGRSGAFTFVDSGAVGKGGNINISTGSLSLTNGAQLSSSTGGQGDAGNISIGVADTVSLANSSYILGAVEPGGQGKGANININARSLSVTSGSRVGALLYQADKNLPGGQGRGGEIRVNASDFVTLSGISSDGFSSGLSALSESGASGPAGNITVSTSNFRIADGAIVSAGTFNSGKGGDITITAKNFEALNGARVVTNTGSTGKAGNITLNVADSVTLSGSDRDGYVSGLFANTELGSSGDGGNILIDPIRLKITNGAGVVVDSKGSGRGGSLNVQADYLTLDNNASLSATATSAEGGNIVLDVPSLLLIPIRAHRYKIGTASEQPQ